MLYVILAALIIRVVSERNGDDTSGPQLPEYTVENNFRNGIEDTRILLNSQICTSKPALQSIVAFMELPEKYLFLGALLTTEWIIVAHTLVKNIVIDSGQYFVRARIGYYGNRVIKNYDHWILDKQQAPWNKLLSFVKIKMAVIPDIPFVDVSYVDDSTRHIYGLLVGWTPDEGVVQGLFPSLWNFEDYLFADIYIPNDSPEYLIPKGSLIINDGLAVGIALGVNVRITIIAGNPANNMHKFIKIGLIDRIYIKQLKRIRFDFEIFKRMYEESKPRESEHGESSNQNQ